MPSLRLLQAPRASLNTWTRQRLVDISVELSVLRADLERLRRRCTQVGKCDRCTHWSTTVLQDNGFFYCRRCALVAKGVSA